MNGALVAIVTRVAVGKEGTPIIRIAVVLGAGVIVDAIKRRTTHALSTFASISQGARISVGAGSGQRRMDTPILGLTTVFCARIVVITEQHFDARTVALNTAVHRGARIAIVALAADRTEDTVAVLAGFGGAWIVVIAVDGRACLA